MKKVYLLGAILLSAGLWAQTPGGRTNQTIVADVVAQIPAQQQQAYNELVQQLSTTGEEGVGMLLNRIHASGQGSNAQVDYALSGLSHFVMAPGNETARQIVVNAYVKGLGLTADRETKAFIIRQLAIAGQDEAVPALAVLLNNEELSGPAARALASIGTTQALDALVKALNDGTATGKPRRDMILAIGEKQAPGAETALLKLVAAADEDTRKDIMYLLGRVGSTQSIGTLSGAAALANYRMEKTGANEAYIALLTRLATPGNKEVAKAVGNLLKAATKAGATQTRIAALEILFSTQEQPAKMVLTAMKDPDKEFRNAALNFASAYANEAMYIDLVKVMAKATPAVKVDILNWLRREAACPDKKTILQNLEIRFDLPARNLFLDQLKSEDFAVKQAAAWLLVRMGDTNNIPALAGLLTSSDQQVILLAQDALAAFPGDIAPTVAKVIPAAPDVGKIAALELLAMRKASANINSVFEQTRSVSPEVSLAAHLALKDVAAEREFTQLCGMLETSTPATAPMIQQGVITALSTMPAGQQVQLINRRMIQAGDSKKHLYYIVLAATGQPEALTQIVKELHSSTGATRDAAFEALLAWQGPKAAGELYTVCLDNSLGSYFDRAIDRYIELVSTPAVTGENRLLSLRKAMEIAHSNVQRNNILRQIERTGTFIGMIYAGQFLDNPATAQAAANAVMNIALTHPEYTGANVRALLEKVSSLLDNPDAGYQREAIKKHLDEMPAGEGFVSIFNGKDLTGWKGLVADPIKRSKMTPVQLAKAQEKADEQMRKDWKVENGLLVFDGTGYDNLYTVKQYGDIEMYIDWMLDPASPEADAGIYLCGTPQV